MADDKQKAILDKYQVSKGGSSSDVMDAINKVFKTSVGKSAGESETADNDSIIKYSTGILSLDQYLGVGGLLGGRILNIAGWEGGGKTLTALTIIAALQIQNKKCAFLDAEGTFSPQLARAIGVNLDELMLFFSTPEKILTGEDYYTIVNMLIQSGIDFIVVDSIPALIPSSRLTATLGQGQKAVHAQMMAEGLQQVTTLLNAQKTSVVLLINQMRGQPMQMFGPSEDYTGGNALRFFQSYCLEVKKVEDIVKKVPKKVGGGFEDRRIGVTVQARLSKNKTATIPMKSIQYNVYFEAVTDDKGMIYTPGVDVVKDLVETAIASGVIVQASSWYSFEDIKTNGSDKMIEVLRDPKASVTVERIRNKVLGYD